VLEQQPCRPLDVREEERDRAGWKLAHPPIMKRTGLPVYLVRLITRSPAT
jgi:hypothetical protein